MTSLEIVAFVLILGAAALGGYYPLVKRASARGDAGFPNGEAFTAGVFMALSLVIMLPAGFHLFGKAFPSARFPWAALLACLAFLLLLAIEHMAAHARSRYNHEELSPPAIPIIMTMMIAVPSFLLGTALGISDASSAEFILLAVLAHKSSAGFGLALAMARSRLSHGQSLLLYCGFAFATPIGILAGADARLLLSGDAVTTMKAITLSLAAGVFLYMATVHEFRNAPMIRHCSSSGRFSLMLAGLLLTVGVRVVMGLGHAG